MKYLGVVSKPHSLAQPTTGMFARPFGYEINLSLGDRIYAPPIRDYVMSANIVSVDGYIVKNRYGSDTKVPENHISGNYFEIFWDEERKILKLCSKKSLREEKLKKILE